MQHTTRWIGLSYTPPNRKLSVSIVKFKLINLNYYRPIIVTTPWADNMTVLDYSVVDCHVMVLTKVTHVDDITPNRFEKRFLLLPEYTTYTPALGEELKYVGNGIGLDDKYGDAVEFSIFELINSNNNAQQPGNADTNS